MNTNNASSLIQNASTHIETELEKAKAFLESKGITEPKPIYGNGGVCTAIEPTGYDLKPVIVEVAEQGSNSFSTLAITI